MSCGESWTLMGISRVETFGKSTSLDSRTSVSAWQRWGASVAWKTPVTSELPRTWQELPALRRCPQRPHAVLWLQEYEKYHGSITFVVKESQNLFSLSTQLQRFSFLRCHRGGRAMSNLTCIDLQILHAVCQADLLSSLIPDRLWFHLFVSLRLK